MAVSAPGVAAGDAPDSQAASTEGTVFFQGFDRVFGAGRAEAASGTISRQGMEDGRKDQFVAFDQEDEEPSSHGLVKPRMHKNEHESF